jgi:hypothetical protein
LGEVERPWTWGRLVRVALIVFAITGGVDLALRETEETLIRAASDGALRNRDGRASADACERVLFELPPGQVARAVVFAGSSVTYGSNLHATEALPAQLAREWRRDGDRRPVFNCAQEGGRPASAISVAAALASHPAALVLMEIMVPSYVARSQAAAPPWSEGEVALLEGAGPAGRERLALAGLWPTWSERVEAELTRFVRAHWRLYRIRGSLWIDDHMAPEQLAWTVRRMAAAAGILPKRFHGQTTNVGKLPWREAYVGGQRPSQVQRIRVPAGRLSGPDYEALLLVRDLLAEAKVPVLFYEIPINLAFQREFSLMSESDLERLEHVRTLLLERMAADGLPVLAAPAMPDDGFLDKAHLTAKGASRLAQHLRGAVEARLAQRHERQGR